MFENNDRDNSMVNPNNGGLGSCYPPLSVVKEIVRKLGMLPEHYIDEQTNSAIYSNVKVY